MKNIALLLNIPWTMIGILLTLSSIPICIFVKADDKVLVFIVRKLWVNELFLGRKVNGFVMGNIILIAEQFSDNIYKHELVHVGQFQKLPFIFPILYCIESFRSGYLNNEYEIEAREQSKDVKVKDVKVEP